MSGAPRIDLLLLDVDGVLTDGRIRIDDRGVETKVFHVRDGYAIRRWLEAGRQLAIVTGRAGGAVRARADELGITHVLQGVRDKGAATDALARRLECPRERIAAVGDDVPDLPMLAASGYPVAVADAVRAVREAAEFVTVRPGGAGAVREVIEHLMDDFAAG